MGKLRPQDVTLVCGEFRIRIHRLQGPAFQPLHCECTAWCQEDTTSCFCLDGTAGVPAAHMQDRLDTGLPERQPCGWSRGASLPWLPT